MGRGDKGASERTSGCVMDTQLLYVPAAKNNRVYRSAGLHLPSPSLSSPERRATVSKPVEIVRFAKIGARFPASMRQDDSRRKERGAER